MEFNLTPFRSNYNPYERDDDPDFDDEDESLVLGNSDRSKPDSKASPLLFYFPGRLKPHLLAEMEQAGLDDKMMTSRQIAKQLNDHFDYFMPIRQKEVEKILSTLLDHRPSFSYGEFSLIQQIRFGQPVYRLSINPVVKTILENEARSPRRPIQSGANTR